MYIIIINYYREIGKHFHRGQEWGYQPRITFLPTAIWESSIKTLSFDWIIWSIEFRF